MKKGLLAPLRFLSVIFIAGTSTCLAQQSASSPIAPVKTGAIPYVFQTVPGWAKLPANSAFGPTHGGVAVDSVGNVYVSTDSASGIFVFARDGTFKRTMAPDFAGTVALQIHREDGKDYLYGAHLRGGRAFKMTLDGTPVLLLPAPLAAGIYGKDGLAYRPSGIAVAADGSIYVSDGYGANYVHKYNRSGEYLGSFGGPGKGDGQFAGCLGMAVDNRFDPPMLMVCDCGNNRLQYFDLDGRFVKVATNIFAKPVAVSVLGRLAAVAENDGRVTLIDQNSVAVTNLGDNPDSNQWGNFRLTPANWQEGVFVAPHGICWDRETASLYVQEWSLTGRITKLNPVLKHMP